jgi:hypothetical protein
MKMLLPMLPAYLLQFRGTLDIDVDEEAVAEIWETVKEMVPEKTKNIIELGNNEARDALTDLKGFREGKNSPFAGKSKMEIVNDEEGPWKYISGHKDVKTP